MLGTDFDLDGGLIRDVSHALRGEGFDASEDGTGRGTPLIPAVSPALKARDHKGPSSDGDGDGAPILPVPIDMRQASRGATMTNNRQPGMSGGAPGTGIGEPGDPAPSLSTSHTPAIAIQERAICENPKAGPDGAGIRVDGAAYTMEARSVPQSVPQSVAFDLRGREGGAMPEGPHDLAAIRAASGGSSHSYIAQPMAVRRLTPTECERLQGFPADYTLIPHGKRLKAAAREDLAAYFERTGQYMKEVTGGAWVFDREAFEAAWPAMAADGPRYKALGNSMAVNVMSWIGERIALVDAAMAERDEAA